MHQHALLSVLSLFLMCICLKYVSLFHKCESDLKTLYIMKVTIKMNVNLNKSNGLLLYKPKKVCV